MPMVSVGASAFEETEQPKSLKKLSLKSLKCGLDIFPPVNEHYAPLDPQRFMQNMGLQENCPMRLLEIVPLQLHKINLIRLQLHQKYYLCEESNTNNYKIQASIPSRSLQKTIRNAMAVNEDGVMATAGDNGSLWF